jgi:hypothetical protein
MSGGFALAAPCLAALLALGAIPGPAASVVVPSLAPSVRWGATAPGIAPNTTAVGNFTAAIQRLVTLVGLSGGGLLALVWTRVALSWFSNDVTKKVQAKERARDALVGTLLFTAALTGLIWGLAHWVLTGS